MQYHEYISADNARREREQQLLNRYDQKPAGKRASNVWLNQVDRSVTSRITGNELIGICAGLVIVAVILLLAIWI